MTDDTNVALAEVVKAAGEDWLLSGGDPTASTADLRGALGAAETAYRRLYPPGSSTLPPLSLPNLISENQRNPHRVRAVLQAVGARFSPEFVALAWRLVNGDLITAVDFGYQMRLSVHLEVTVQESDTNTSRTFSSTELRDTRLFRHLSITEANGTPTFSTFLALRR